MPDTGHGMGTETETTSTIVSITHFDSELITDELGAITWRKQADSSPSPVVVTTHVTPKFGNGLLSFSQNNAMGLIGTFSDNIFNLQLDKLAEERTFYDIEYFLELSESSVASITSTSSSKNVAYLCSMGPTNGSFLLNLILQKNTDNDSLYILDNYNAFIECEHSELQYAPNWNHILIRFHFDGNLYLFINGECWGHMEYYTRWNNVFAPEEISLSCGNPGGELDEFIIRKTQIAQDDTTDYGEDAIITIPTEQYTIEEDDTMAGEQKYCTWTATGLPAGLSISSAGGYISGTPTANAGTYTPSITVTTDHGSDTQTMTIIVVEADSNAPVIDAGQSVTVTKGEAMTPYMVTGTNVR